MFNATHEAHRRNSHSWYVCFEADSKVEKEWELYLWQPECNAASPGNNDVTQWTKGKLVHCLFTSLRLLVSSQNLGSGVLGQGKEIEAFTVERLTQPSTTDLMLLTCKPQQRKLISPSWVLAITLIKCPGPRGLEDEDLERSQEDCPLQTRSLMVLCRLLLSVHCKVTAVNKWRQPVYSKVNDLRVGLGMN